MLADALKFLSGQAKDTLRIRVEEVPYDPRKALLVKPDGAHEFLDVPAPDRKAELATLASFCAFLECESRAPNPEVYVGPDAAYAILDAEDRREKVSFNLVLSEQFRLLESLKGGRSFSPKAAIRFLRFELPESRAETLIQGLKNVDFDRRGSGHHHTAHGSESLGKTVEAKVQQADKIPESFVATMRVWSNPGLGGITERAQVGVHIDPTAEEVELILLPDEYERALWSAREQLADAIRQFCPEIPVFAGTP